MQRTYIFVFMLLLVANIFAQNRDIQFSKSEFPNNPKELAVAKEQIKNGGIKIDEQNYDEALKLLLKAYKFNPNNSSLNFDIGICYYNSPQKYKVLEYIEKAYSLNPQIAVKNYKDIKYYLARGYHLNYKFEEAKKYYNEYLNKKKKSKINDSEEIQKYIQECGNGIEILKNPIDAIITNLGENVNTEFREYAPLVVSDGSKIYFTSRRKGIGGSLANDGLYFEDIYETYKTDNGWTKAKNIGTPLNTKEHDAAIGLSPDGQQLYIYVDVNGGDIYVSKLQGSRWLKPVSISEKINSKYHESKACISYDNKTLYFISDRPDKSIGGKDIFYSELDEKGNWSEPINIGNKINTKYDEVDFFLHPDGRTIYFSSNGHNTMGGFDIFKTVKDKNGEWQTPVNLGYPINTPDDDVFFVTTARGNIAYFSSVREGGMGTHDLYEIKFQETQKKEVEVYSEKIIASNLVTLVKGTVSDAKTQLPLEANIDIVDLNNNKSVANFKTNSQSGKYIINLPSGKNYGLNVNKEGYLFYSENFNLPDNTEYQEYTIDIQLNKIEIGTTITLKNIFFDYDKSTLRPESQTELNNVVEILNKYPNIKIEISGHTDNKGSDEYNKNLSKERAKTIVEYLKSKNIAENRLSYVGYGKEIPIATNDTEEGRQMNRRVEFKIIGK